MFTNHLLYCREGDGESMSVPHRTVYKTSCASELTSLAVLPPADCNTDGQHTTDRHTTGRHTNGRYTNRPVRLFTQSLLFKYILVILACLVKGKYILVCLVKGKNNFFLSEIDIFRSLPYHAILSVWKLLSGIFH